MAAALFRVGLLVTSMLLLCACGSEDAPRPGQSSSSGVEVVDRDSPSPGNTPPGDQQPQPGDGGGDPGDNPGDDEPPDEPDPQEPGEPEEPGQEPEEPGEEPGQGQGEEPETPLLDILDSNVFFPVQPGIGWYFDDNPQPFMLGAPREQGSEIIWPLEHSDILSGFFTSTPTQVGLKGVHVLLLAQANPVYLDITFATTRPILADNSPLDTNGSTTIRADGILGSLAVPVRLTATRAGTDWMDIPGLGQQPAQRIQVTLRLGFSWIQRQLILVLYPWLAPAFDPVSFDLWFVPGVGLVGAEMNDVASQVQGVIAIPAPVAISTPAGRTPAPQVLLLNGEPITHLEWEPTIHYRTAQQNWLDVRFDSSGSWFAHITRANLPRGIHAATVRFHAADASHDVTVSVLVE